MSAFVSVFRRLAEQKGEAYAMGWDAAVNGPNTTNCHFATFGTPETRDQWQAGNDAGKRFNTGPTAAGEFE